MIIEGLKANGRPQAVAVEGDGSLLTDSRAGAASADEMLLLEMRAVRIGLELLNNIKPGTLLALAEGSG